MWRLRRRGGTIPARRFIDFWTVSYIASKTSGRSARPGVLIGEAPHRSVRLDDDHGGDPVPEHELGGLAQGRLRGDGDRGVAHDPLDLDVDFVPGAAQVPRGAADGVPREG